MKTKAVATIMVTMLLVGMLSLGGFVIPVLADEYKKTFSDWGQGGQGWTWASAVPDNDETFLAGYAWGDPDLSRGRLEMYTLTAGLGGATVEGNVAARFDYDGEDWWNWIEVEYYIKGYMEFTEIKFSVGAYCKVEVRVEVWDVTNPDDEWRKEEVDSLYKEIHVSWFGIKYWSIDRTIRESFEEKLYNGHTYEVRLYAKTFSWCCGGTFATTDFSDELHLGGRVDLERVEIRHSHEETTTQHNPYSGVEVWAKYSLEQDKYPNASRLDFTSYNEDRDINGWRITTTKFSSSWSAADGDRAINVRAWGERIPMNSTVEVDVTQWLTEGNAMGLRDVIWHEATEGAEVAQAQAQAMPNHHWSLGYPVPDPLRPGCYRHSFTMTNDNPHNLIVGGLTFLPDMTYHESLSNISFADPVCDFELSPGGNWTTDIITEDDFVGGYIYFKYSIFNMTGEEVVCNAWGGHPVTEGPPPESGIDVSVDITVVNGTILQVWGKPISAMMLEGKPTCINIIVTATRQDANPVSCFIVIGILRNETVIDSKTVLMGAGETKGVEFFWFETGIDPGDYEISARGGPVESGFYDTDLNNNVAVDDYVPLKWLMGDIKCDGIVDIYDALTLRLAYGCKLGDPNWNPNADLDPWPMGNEEIDVYDALVVRGCFGNEFP